MTVKELSEKTGVSKHWLYELCRRLGRVPTVEEVEDRKALKIVKRKGRPLKYGSRDDENE